MVLVSSYRWTRLSCQSRQHIAIAVDGFSSMIAVVLHNGDAESVLVAGQLLVDQMENVCVEGNQYAQSGSGPRFVGSPSGRSLFKWVAPPGPSKEAISDSVFGGSVFWALKALRKGLLTPHVNAKSQLAQHAVSDWVDEYNETGLPWLPNLGRSPMALVFNYASSSKNHF
jgi:hypothetical protein